MSHNYADIELENLLAHRSMAVKAQVDSSAVFLSVPEHIAVQLGFDVSRACGRDIVLANGQRESVPMIGPVRVRFADRYCDLSALVVGDEPLLGAVPMEMMDLVVQPDTHALSINPASPYVPTTFAK